MKIYIYRYGSLCEPDIIDAFKRIGLEIVEESAEIYNKSIIPSESAALASSVLTKGGFAFAFTINFFPWLSDICQLLNITYISLIVDSPVLELYSNAISNPVNRIFLFDKMLYEEFEQYNKGHIFHMPLAANTSRTDEIISLAWRYNYSTFIVCAICCKCIKCFCSISTHRIYFCSIITKCLKS